MKEIRAVCEAFPQSKILILALHERDLPEWERIADRVEIRRVRLKSRSWSRSLPVQFIKLIEWSWRVLVSARAFEPDLVHSHSLGTLPSSVLIKLVTGARLIYDAHELETERNGESGIRQSLSKLSEKILMQSVDEVLVVCESIAEWYKRTYKGKRVSVLYNVPSARASTLIPDRDLHAEIGASADDVVFLYLGAMESGRGIPLLLECFRGQPANRKLIFIGYGSLATVVKESAKTCGNIWYLPAVPPDQVVATASSADVGICLLDGDALSYRYALPNKLFEYRAAGLPAIVNADYPEMARFISTDSAGWLVLPSIQTLQALLATIDMATVNAKKQELRLRGEPPTWEQEVPKLIAAYTR